MKRYLCTCPTPKPVKHLEYLGYVPLHGGSHTAFTPLFCLRCGRLDFLPRENYELLLREGDNGTILRFKGFFGQLIQYYRRTSPWWRRLRYWIRDAGRRAGTIIKRRGRR